MQPEKSLYYIALVPEESIAQEILDFKLDAKDKFNTQLALRSIAHITIVPPFNATFEQLELLSNILYEKSKIFSNIELLASGFDHFAKNTIFVKIINTFQLEDIYHEIYHPVAQIISINSADRFVPHITIANRDIPQERFNEIYNYFKSIDYNKSFRLDRLVLFKHEDNRWQIYKTYQLN